jgi:hypothetical protein
VYVPSDGEDDLEHDPGPIGEGRVEALGLGDEALGSLARPRRVFGGESTVEGAARRGRDKVGGVGVTQ